MLYTLKVVYQVFLIMTEKRIDKQFCRHTETEKSGYKRTLCILAVTAKINKGLFQCLQ